MGRHHPGAGLTARHRGVHVGKKKKDGGGDDGHKPPEGFTVRFTMKIPPAVWAVTVSGGATPVIIWALLIR
jgi:hypothetical protein